MNPETAAAAARGRGVAATLALIALVTFAAYARTLSYGFVNDDHAHIVGNWLIASPAGLPAIFTQHSWSNIDELASTNYYRPIFLVWLMTNHRAFGLDPLGWHLSTVLVHVAVTLLVYVVARRLGLAAFTAAAAAVVFGLHPAHAESVAWLSGVTDPLMALLMLGAFAVHLGKPANRAIPPAARAAATLGLYALALLSKETAIVLPALVFVHAWTSAPGADGAGTARRRARFALTAVAPYAVVTLAYLGVRMAVLGGLGFPVIELAWHTIVLTWPSLLWTYLMHLAWPFGVSPYYEPHYVETFSVREVLAPLLALLAVGAALARWSRGRPAVLLAAALIVVPLLPLLDLRVFQWGETFHDRYLYLSSIGFALLAGMAIAAVPAIGGRAFGLPGARIACVVGIGAVYALTTFASAHYWKDDLSLFGRGVEVAPGNDVATHNLATLELRRGRTDEAIRLYERVLARSPDSGRTVFDLGQTYFRTGRNERARTYFARATELQPENPEPWLYHGLNEARLGAADEAERALRHAGGLAAGAPGYHFALARFLEQQGRAEEALAAYREEAAVNPAEPRVAAAIARLQPAPGN